MSKQAYKFWCCPRRMFKLKMAVPPEDIVNLFNEYSDNGVMNIEGLHRFLVEFQGENKATLDHAQAIFNSLTHHHVFHRRGLHLDAFFRYLFGELNPPLAHIGVILSSLQIILMMDLMVLFICFVSCSFSFLLESTYKLRNNFELLISND